MPDHIDATVPGTGVSSVETPITFEAVVDHQVSLAKMEDELAQGELEAGAAVAMVIRHVNANFRATTIALAALERQINGLAPAEDIEHAPPE